jgi:phosphohistidine phosphatase
MQRQLVLMRHGHAEEGRDDHARRLTEAGRAAARRAGLELARAGFSPQRILSSAAPRARETAELVAQACAYGGSIQPEPALYLGEAPAYLAALRRLPADVERVLLVGHNPVSSGLVRQLGSPSAKAGAELGPADYAELSLELDSWQDL